MAQKLNSLNLSLIALGEYNGGEFQSCIVFHIINENLVREIIIDNSGQVSIYPLIVVETGDCEVGDFKVDMRCMGVFETVNLISIWHNCASTEKCCVTCILSINVNFSVS
jgi:hypothetical protein